MKFIKQLNESQKVITRQYIANFLKRIQLAKDLNKEMQLSPHAVTPEGALLSEQLKEAFDIHVSLVKKAVESGMESWSVGYQFSLFPFLDSDEFTRDLEELLDDDVTVLLVPMPSGNVQHVVLTTKPNMDALYSKLTSLGYLDCDLARLDKDDPFKLPVIQGLSTLTQVMEADEYLGK